MRIRVLGCSGGIGGDLRTTSMLIDDDILVDAGTGVGDLSIEQLVKVDHVFVSHAHLDHVTSIPFLVDTVCWMRDRPITIYSTAATIQVLKEHLFNWKIWPDFSEIPNGDQMCMVYREITVGETLDFDGRKITAIPAVHTVPATGFLLDSGNATALYLGYLWQRNNLVYGGELAYTRLKDNFVTGFTCCEVDRSIDLKGRVGMAANRVLFYGVLGYSMSSYDEGSGNWDPSGLSYGLGVDFRATQRLNIGLEYLARDLNGDNPNGLGQEVNIDLDTVSLRVGLSF